MTSMENLIGNPRVSPNESITFLLSGMLKNSVRAVAPIDVPVFPLILIIDF